jgi:HD-GYP domain-containing protein (c-di-GMP phosphodiesterase class II)
MALPRRYPLHVQIAVVMVLLVLGCAVAIAVFQYWRATRILEAGAADYFRQIEQSVESDLRGALQPATVALAMLAESDFAATADLPARLAAAHTLAPALDAGTVSSLYFGFPDGAFFLIRRVDPGRPLGDAENAPPGARYVVQSMSGGDTGKRYVNLYLGGDFAPLRTIDRPDLASFDPRRRPWYLAAQESDSLRHIGPYRFFSSGEIGVTLARRSGRPGVVVGLDVTLSALSRALAEQVRFPGMQIAVVSAAGDLIALAPEAHLQALLRDAPGEALPRLAQAHLPALARLLADGAPVSPAGEPPRATEVEAEGVAWLGIAHSLARSGLPDWRFAVAAPADAVLAEARSALAHALGITALIALLAVAVAVGMARVIARPIRSLAAEAGRIRHFDFTEAVEVSSAIREVDELATDVGEMKDTIRSFLEMSASLANEPRFENLIDAVLEHTAGAAHACGAALLFLAADGSRFEVVGARVGAERPPPLAEGIPAEALCQRVERQRGAFTLRPPLAADDPLAGLMGWFFAQLPEGAASAIAAPLHGHDGGLLGVIILALEGEPQPARIAFVEAISGSAAVSLETRELIRAQKRLFDAFIRLIAEAIDTKSPYTGRHCARVPVIAEMLAGAACDATTGPWRDFCLSESQWEALHLAAWLHDCGKVTTPEYVVDKATKLQTLYDRIHEVRMRFEVLKRDAEIACLKAIAAGGDGAALRGELAQTQAILDEEFAFVARCNQGGETLPEETVARLAAIARRSWQRSLDDRLGLSREELERKSGTPATPLPASEPLLADRPEHRIPRPASQCIAPDNPWGFHMAVPEYLYDHGELKNLSVGRGTLSEEERFKINEHIIQTIRMLTQLPYPRHLRAVPEIAGGHHEKMDGSGYPRRLTGRQMSPLARMVAIADIFEALTAGDRPYKPGKTLSEALALMARMRDEGHIDPALFELFLRGGVYRRYAEAYLKPEQIDAVEPEQYLR